MDTLRLLQDITERIFAGESVPVKKEYREMVANQLNSQQIPFTTVDDVTNPERVLFRLVRTGHVCERTNEI